MDKFTTAGIWITRRCPLRCNYCNIPKKDIKELRLDEWIQAVDIIKCLGTKKIVLLGGEVTEYDDLVGVVDYIINLAKLDCSLTTNGFENYNTVKNLIGKGMKNIAVSIDTLNIDHSISPIKCRYSLGLIKQLEKDDLKEKLNLRCYTVVNKNNLSELESFIKHMSQKEIRVYLIPYHWGDEGVFEHRKNHSESAFTTDKDVQAYGEVIDKIVGLKREGYLVDNSEEYLLSSKSHIKNLDWRCNGLSELRIDSDGSLLCCCDRKGEVSKNFTIFDLKDESKIKEFLEMREKDSKSCKGCLWPSSFESEKWKYELSRASYT